MYPFGKDIGGFKRSVKNRAQIEGQYERPTSQRRYQTFTLMFYPRELDLVKMTLKVKAQFN